MFNWVLTYLNTFKLLEGRRIMGTIVTTYAIYTVVSLALTFWVARTLQHNGEIFLVEVFDGEKEMAKAVNHLLVVGFWLINIGYIALALKVTGDVIDARDGFEALAVKLGGVALVLGFMHFFNLFVLTRIRRNRRIAHQTRPIPPLPPMGFPFAQRGPVPQVR